MAEARHSAIYLLSTLPIYSFLSAERRRKLESEYSASMPRIPIAPFMNLAFLVSFLFSALCTPALMILGFGAMFSFALPAVVFCCLFMICLLLPGMLSGAFARRAESDLPMLVGELAVYLKMRLPFERAIENISKSGYSTSLLFEGALRSVSAGATMQQALFDCARKVRSPYFMRAIQQMAIEYEEGTDGESLLLLSEEISSSLSARAKEASAKSAIFGLLYIASAALLPAFFSILSVGSAAVESAMPTLQIWIFFIVLFPAANCAVLLLMAKASGVFPELWGQRGHIALQGPSMRPAHFAASIIAGCAIALAASFSPFGIMCALAVAALPGAISHLQAMREDSLSNSMDLEMPLCLMAASSQPRGLSIEKAIQIMSKASSGHLASELAKISRQASSGIPIQQALSEAASSGSSWLFRRSMHLLSAAYRGGGAMSGALRHTAKYMLAMQSLVLERRASFALQRYTLLFSAFAVPAIIAVVLSMSDAISQTLSSMPSGIFYLPSAALSESVSAATSAAQAYLVIFAICTAAFIGMHDGKRGSLVPYALLIAAISQATFVGALMFASGKIA